MQGRAVMWMAAATMVAGCSGKNAEVPMAPAAVMAPPVAPPGMAMAGAPPPGAALAIARPAGPAVVAADDATGDWATVREFPVPDYSRPGDGPRVDFRDTVFWAPSVRTGPEGTAKLSFYLSDAVTTFRASAEGVTSAGPAQGQAELTSALPISVSARLPVVVSPGDVVRVPVTVQNSSDEAVAALVEAKFGDAFELAGGLPRRLTWVRARRSRTLHFALRVRDADADATVRVSVEAGDHADAIERSARVVPRGFPVEEAVAGTLRGTARHVLSLPRDASSVDASLRLYPSPVSSMLAGTEAMLAEPVGCFEQASSANYPNVMVMQYLATSDALEPALAAETRAVLARGYDKLVGYESPDEGFEWFGGDPGHEALTAYGLMEFAAMAEVFPEVDSHLVARTAAWLESRRDGEGGYLRNARALDSFGRASAEVTNAYITYALVQAGRRDLDTELDHLRALGENSDDPYLLSLVAGALLAVDPSDAVAERALARVVARQDEAGRIGGAAQSITMSGGAALDIETTALAALAMMKSPTRRPRELAAALDWIRSQRSRLGGFASTQATVLALQALTASADAASLPDGATVEVWINGERAATVEASAASDDGAIVVGDLAGHLRAGDNVIELRGRGFGSGGGDAAELPYSIGLDYRRMDPPTSPDAPVALTTRLRTRRPRVGQSVRLTATLRNTTDRGLPMVIARVGLPGGLEAQTWQLDELRSRGVIDFYETRDGEVILYLRSMAPSARRDVDLELLAAIGGRFEGPASTAYLYYTDEHKHWSAPLRARVRPRFASKKATNHAR